MQEFISALRAHAAATTVEFHEQDERFTTAEAQRVLIDADLSRAKRKGVIDQQAAALILQALARPAAARRSKVTSADVEAVVPSRARRRDRLGR